MFNEQGILNNCYSLNGQENRNCHTIRCEPNPHLTSHISHACAHPHRSKQIVHTHIHIHTHTPAHSTHTLATCQTNLTGIHTHKCAHPPSASPPASAASSFLMASLLRLLCLSWTCVRLQLQSVSVMCFICTCVRSQSQSVLVEVCVFL